MKLKRLFVKIFCALIPARGWRKRCRNILLYGRLKDFLVRQKCYDCIFSLGEACFIASSLKRAGLRRFSGPFDWVADAPFEKRMELLRLGFPGFFNKEDLEPLGQKVSYAADSSVPHAVYYNVRTGLRHPHDFPFHGDFNRAYIALREKYERRCQRLVHMLRTSRNVLMVYGETDKAVMSLEKKEVLSLLSRLQASYPESNLDLLYLKRDNSKAPEQIEVQEEGNLFFARFRGLDALESTREGKATNEKLRRTLSAFLMTHFKLNESRRNLNNFKDSNKN